MRGLSYEPREDDFFVEATWDEYRQLSAKYEIDHMPELSKYKIGNMLLLFE